MIIIYQHYHLIFFLFFHLAKVREMAILLREQLNKRLGRLRDPWDCSGSHRTSQRFRPSLVRMTNRRGTMQQVGIGILRLSGSQQKHPQKKQGWTLGFREGVKFVFLKNRCSWVSKERNCSTFSPGQCEKNRRNMLLYLDHSWSLYFLSIHQNWTSRHSFLDSCVWNLLYVFR